MISKFKSSRQNGTLLFILLISFTAAIGLTGCTGSEATPVETPSAAEVSGENLTIIENQQPIYYGEWIINKVQAFGIGTYSKEDAESLLGKSLSFAEDKASGFGDQLSEVGKPSDNPAYTEEVISESDFAVKYRILFDDLGIEEDAIREVNVTGPEGHVSTFFIKDNNTLIILGGGTYFELVRKDT